MGEIKEAIEIYKLNRMAYPEAADATNDLAERLSGRWTEEPCQAVCREDVGAFACSFRAGSFWNDTAQSRDTCDDAKDVLKKVEGKSQ
jgi:hypothetical protein